MTLPGRASGTAAAGSGVGGRPGLRRGAALLLAAMVALTACSGPEPAPPAQELADAFAATLDDAFAFEVVLEADGSALAGLGDQAGVAAAMLQGVRLAGVVDGTDTDLELFALGGSVLELRQVEGTLYLRAGLVDLLRRVGVDEFATEQDLLDQVEATGMPSIVADAVMEAFDGGWVGLEGGVGAVDLGGLGGIDAPDGVDDLATATDASAGAAVLDALGTDLRGFFDRFVDVEDGAADDGRRTFAVSLRLGDLLRAAARVGDSLAVGGAIGSQGLEDDLAGLPAAVDGAITVDDGVVTSLRFDIAAAARTADLPVEGRLVLQITLSDHGTVDAVQPPVGALVVPAVDAEAALVALLGAVASR